MDSGESKPESAFFEAWPYPPPYEDDFRPSRGHRILRRSGSSSKVMGNGQHFEELVIEVLTSWTLALGLGLGQLL